MVNEAVGFDAGKKLKGRKRFTLVDTLGLLLMVKVVAADTPERAGAKQLLAQMNQERARVPRLAKIWFDGGFSGFDFLQWVMDLCHWVVDVVLRPTDAKGFVLLPKRWTDLAHLWLASLVSSSQS